MCKLETLREYLDRIHIFSGDDNAFVVQVLFEGTEMNVSRRYLESEPWKHMLDMIIIDYEFPYVDIYGRETIKFIVH